MTKIEFLRSLRDKLSGLPEDDREERLRFYTEMIEDRMEEGLSEEDAVAAIGSVEAIAEPITDNNGTQIMNDSVAQTADDIPPAGSASNKEKTKRRLRAWEIVLLVLGSPIWVSLLIAVLAVVLSLYAALWSVIVSLWAVFVSLIACALYGVVAGSVFAFCESAWTGMALIGAGLVCGGISIFLFYGCKAATKGITWLTGKLICGIKNIFVKKEAML